MPPSLSKKSTKCSKVRGAGSRALWTMLKKCIICKEGHPLPVRSECRHNLFLSIDWPCVLDEMDQQVRSAYTNHRAQFWTVFLLQKTWGTRMLGCMSIIVSRAATLIGGVNWGFNIGWDYVISFIFIFDYWFSIRDGSWHQNEWFFGKIQNGLWPPPHFRKIMLQMLNKGCKAFKNWQHHNGYIYMQVGIRAR